MPSLRSLALLIPALLSTASALPANCKRARALANGKAIYILTNEAENAVVAVPIGPNGQLLAEGTTSTKTGGAGGAGIDGAANAPAAPDSLFSQGALTVAGKSLFAVNPGSNTVTMFSISGDTSTTLTMVGRPVPIQGEFPVTVAASAKHKLVCVGSTGAKSGISCANFDTITGLGEFDGLRDFELGQTTPPVGPTNTVSHAFFSDDESSLFVTVKGDPAVQGKRGFFSVFPVETDCSAAGADMPATLARTDTRSSPLGTLVMFGSAPVPGSRNGDVFVTDASFGAAIVRVDKQTDRAATVGNQDIAGQKATCWVAISPFTRTAFVTDVAVNRLIEMSVGDAGVLGEVNLATSNSDPGLLDIRAAGTFVYALSPGNGTTGAAISVVDVSGGRGRGKAVQHFEGLAQLGAGKNSMGMAILP